MSEETKKVEQIEQEADEVQEQNLDSIAGGGPGDGIGGVEVGLRKKPGGRPSS